MSILVKYRNSSNDKSFFKLINNRDELNPSLNPFIYMHLNDNYDYSDDDLLVELIYPHHTEVYLEYHLDYKSR